jgi:hypothetical protein
MRIITRQNSIQKKRKNLYKKYKGLSSYVEDKNEAVNLLEKKMLAGVTDKVAAQEYHPQVEKDTAEYSVHTPNTQIPTDESGNPVVVSKDFILNLLSLAIGKPFFLEGNLGQSVDVRI